MTDAPGSGWTEDQLVRVMLNPIYAIEIDPNLALPHPPVMPEAKWVVANVKLIKDVGAEVWLTTLLDVLKGGYV